jgi:hypothetical protein
MSRGKGRSHSAATGNHFQDYISLNVLKKTYPPADECHFRAAQKITPLLLSGAQFLALEGECPFSHFRVAG